MSAKDIVVLLLLAAWLVWAVRQIVRDRRRGCHGCGSSCSGHCASCKRKCR